jgi:hypothetical protein
MGSRECEQAWPGIEPWLNDALSSLTPSDREAVLMRYFDGLSVREIASEIGINEDTAGKRITRALDRMRRFLKGKEVPVSSVILSAALAEHATVAVPAGLAKSIALAPTLPLPSIANVEHSLSPIGKGISTMSIVKFATALICGAAFVIGVTTGLVRHRTIAAAAQPATMAIPAADAVLLRYKFHAGEVDTYAISQDQQGSATIGGTVVPIRQQIAMVMKRTIDSVGPDGSATGTMQMTSMQVIMNGQPVNLPAATQAAYLKPQSMTISPTGEVKATQPPAQASDPMAGGMFNSMEESGVLPNQPVGTGATWQAAEKLPSMGMQISIPCTLTGFQTHNGHKIAQIGEIFNATMTPGNVSTTPMNGTMNGTGTEYFDSDRGTSLGNDLTFKMDATMNVSPPGQPAHAGHVVLDIRMRMQLEPST